jgi:hypothetical protein
MRNYRLPRRFHDLPPAILEAARRIILHVRDSFRTAVNKFGILQEYLHRPSYDPDVFVKLEDLANFRVLSESTTCLPNEQLSYSFLSPWPFKNMSKYLLMNWHQTGSSQKTEAELNHLVKEVIGNPEFHPDDLADFSTHWENKQLDDARATADSCAPFLDDERSL